MKGSTMESISQQAANLRQSWETDQRWAGTRRDYSAQDVIRLRGSVLEEHTLAKRGAKSRNAVSVLLPPHKTRRSAPTSH